MPFLEPADMIQGEPLPGWTGRFFHSENMTFAHYDIVAGAAPLHEHEHEQEEVWNVVEGELELIVGGVARRMRAGTAAIVPPHTLHSVRPIGPCRAVIVDYPLRTSLPGLNRSP
jgi:mannose-6-phosphate isomerase-like protein (cupin superfamily)